MDELTGGWLTVLIGIILLGCEVFSPGFFLAVPGTVLVILGILMVLGVDILSNGIGIITGIISALVASGITVWMYGRLTPGNQNPQSTSQDSLIGSQGIVTAPVNPTNISGKVTINGQNWSARSMADIQMIPPGTAVVVVSAQGVHVVVKPLEESN
jgi:membrane protein implicated in regulation of membrane protease activity